MSKNTERSESDNYREKIRFWVVNIGISIVSSPFVMQEADMMNILKFLNRFYLLIFLERGKGGRKKERNIDVREKHQ